MRLNVPITQVEYMFSDGDSLVTTTDLKGRILYCNPSFIEASGYTKEELLGQPHNLIRHPDMPEEAFRDMWSTISQGLPWFGMVKNRRKNGDFYWVKANVTPLLDAHGEVTGYMSVRNRPDRAAAQEAEVLYQRMKAGGDMAGALKLDRGRLLPSQPLARALARLRPGLKGKMVALSGGLGLLGFLLGEYQAGGLSHMSFNELTLGVLTCLGGALVGGVYLTRQVLRPLASLTSAAHQMAGGNLTVSISTAQSDEIGRLSEALAQLNANVTAIVRDARRGVSHLRNDTAEIALGNGDLNERTVVSAEQLQRTAASVEQITASVSQSSYKAEEASSMASTATRAAEASAASVAELSESMKQIHVASARVMDIIQVVDEIAFQTNLLALNAAVESARAGEHGKGFAVVAGEVRTLAQRSAMAAREVRALIKDTVQQVEVGDAKTQVVQQGMNDVQHSIHAVHAYIAEISQGMQEQTQGIQQVNNAISALDGITQQNAALVERIAHAAVDVNRKADDVGASVAVFRLDGDSVHAQPDAVGLRQQVRRIPSR